MAIQIGKEEKEGKCLLILNGDMCIYDAQVILNEMREGFSGYDGLFLDLEGVTACDITGVQLICSALKTGDDEKKGFGVLNASTPVTKAWAQAGVDSEKFPSESKI